MLPQLRSWLAALLGHLPSTWLGWAALVGMVFLGHWAYFTALPHWAVARFESTRPDGLRRYLGWVAATPSLLGSGHKFLVRSALTGTYLVQGRYAEVVAYGRANLAALERARHRADAPALEADIRRQLADALEGLGRLDEAEEERRLGAEALARAPVDSFQLLIRGKALERENRYAEACDAYERSLAAGAGLPRTVRIQTMAHLFLASYNAGRPAECLRWAEATIAAGAKGQTLRGAHRLAGIACGNLGHLGESEDHTRHAFDLATARGDRAEAAEILGSLADLQRKRGQLAEAFETAERAAAGHPKALRISQAVRASILKEWGRYAEALDLLGQHDQASKFAISALERRVQATRALDAARYEAEAGRADDAWAHIQEAVAELGTDAKLGLKCDGAASWVFAVRGLPDDSRRVAERSRARLADFEQDPSTGRGVSFDLGMAAWTRGDHEDAIDCWTRYLDLAPDPVHRPTAFYVRGECHLALGDRVAAGDDFRAAVALEIDSHHARLAGVRLREMGVG